MQTVEELVLKEIEKGNRKTTELLSSISKQRPITKQAFYKSPPRVITGRKNYDSRQTSQCFTYLDRAAATRT